MKKIIFLTTTLISTIVLNSSAYAQYTPPTPSLGDNSAYK